jgi:PIN domain nuclease of toxin-antitoxin system
MDDASRAGSLPGIHRDPFDRMLIAQALARNFVLASNESLFDRYGVRRLW